MVWDRTYGGINDDEVWSLIQTTDGGYAVVWGTYSYGVGGRDFWVIKLNSRGNKLWDKTYGGSNVDYYAESLIQTNDGGYVIAGISYSKGAGADA